MISMASHTPCESYSGSNTCTSSANVDVVSRLGDTDDNRALDLFAARKARTVQPFKDIDISRQRDWFAAPVYAPNTCSRESVFKRWLGGVIEEPEMLAGEPPKSRTGSPEPRG